MTDVLLVAVLVVVGYIFLRVRRELRRIEEIQRRVFADDLEPQRPFMQVYDQENEPAEWLALDLFSRVVR